MDKSATTFLSENELEIITESTQSGRGLLIGVEPQDDSAEGLPKVNTIVDINKLTKVFGVTFSGSVEDPDELQVSHFSSFFEGVQKILEKYYLMLAKFQSS